MTKTEPPISITLHEHVCQKIEEAMIGEYYPVSWATTSKIAKAAIAAMESAKETPESLHVQETCKKSYVLSVTDSLGDKDPYIYKTYMSTDGVNYEAKDGSKFSSASSEISFDDAWEALLAKPDRDCSTYEAFKAGWDANQLMPVSRHRMPDGRPIFGDDSPHDIGEHLDALVKDQPVRYATFEDWREKQDNSMLRPETSWQTIERAFYAGRALVRESGSQWQSLESAPRDDKTVFLLRDKIRLTVIEASFIWESEERDGPHVFAPAYWALCNADNGDALDGDYDRYEWMPCPTTEIEDRESK